MRKTISRRELLKGMVGLTASATLAACVPATGPQSTSSIDSEGGGPGLADADLKVWVWWPDPVASLEEMGESFMEANPNVSVSAEAPTDYWTKLQTSLAGGAGPDIYFMNNVNYWSWASKNVLMDLTELTASDAAMQDNIENSWTGAVDFYNFKGKQFGLPYMYTTVVLYYNEDFLKEQGLGLIADIEDDFDWDMYREYGLQLTQRDGDDVTMWGLMSTEGIETGWLNFVRGNGGDFLNEEHTQCIIDQEASIEAWQYLADMRLEDTISPSPEALQAEGTRSMFLTGKLALWPGGSWTMKTLNEQLTDFNYNIALLPKSPHTGNRGGTTNIVGLVVSNATEAKDQSWALMTHLLSQESQDILARANVLAPVRNDSAELYYDVNLGPANRGAAFRMQEWTTALPTHEQVTWGEMMQPTTEWQTEIFEGRVSVEEGLQNIATNVNDLFAAAG